VQAEFDRFFDMQSHDLALPADVSGSENINDNVIS